MTEEINAGIGKRIRMYRRAAGLTAEALAKEVPGLTRSGLAKIEAGIRAVLPVDLILNIAYALDVAPLAILFPINTPDAKASFGGDERYISDLLPWIVGPRRGASGEWEDSAALLSSAIVEQARALVTAEREVTEKWGADGSLATTDEEREQYRAAFDHAQQMRSALGFFSLHLNSGSRRGDD